MSKMLSFSLIIVFLIVGFGIGYMISPEYKMDTHTMQSSKTLGPSDKYVDLRYLDMMIAHHEVALHMVEQAALFSSRNEIKDLAKTIITKEPSAIDELYGWRKEWYNNSRPVPVGQVPNLGTDDANFDLRFLNAMIAHHNEGIEMAKEIRTKSLRNEVLDDADKVQQMLGESLVTLKEWRAAWYLNSDDLNS
jgi:predicted outer membrane protein